MKNLMAASSILLLVAVIDAGNVHHRSVSPERIGDIAKRSIGHSPEGALRAKREIPLKEHKPLSGKDVWNARDHISMFTNVSRLITTNTSITIFQPPEISFWEISGENFNRKYTCHIEDIDKMSHFPDAPKTIAYNTPSDPNTLIIYDLEFCKSVLQRKFDGEISVINISGMQILLGFQTSWDTLFSWDGNQLTTVMPIIANYYSNIENGVIAYRKSTTRQEASFYDTKTHQMKRIPIGFDFVRVEMSQDASIAVVQEASQESIAIYDVATKRELLTANTQELGQLHTVIRSGDHLYIVLFNKNAETMEDAIAIAYIDLKGDLTEDSFIVSYPRINDVIVFLWQIVPRTIDGVEYLQTISDAGVLRLLRLSDDKKSWSMLE